jgi:hypothetical protein
VVEGFEWKLRLVLDPLEQWRAGEGLYMGPQGEDSSMHNGDSICQIPQGEGKMRLGGAQISVCFFLSFSFFLFLVSSVLGFELRLLHLARQVLSHLCHISRPFLL